MKKIFTLIILLTGLSALRAQLSDTMSVNDISARIGADGVMFINTDYTSEYRVPKSQAASTFYSSGNWIGGIDDGGLLHVAAQTYRQSGGDFWAGPIADDYTGADYMDRYLRNWKMTKAQVDDHIAHWADAGYVVPAAIAEWPGTGNAANGEATVLAPYYDNNNNHIYEPALGDYPLIRGDECIFSIYNDLKLTHFESGGLPLGLEVHCMAYAFNMPDDSALSKTIYFNYQLINRSANNYHSVIMGTFDDFDVGVWSDDYSGCDTTQNMYYAYNGDCEDDGGSPNYGSYPPAQGVVWLNRHMLMFKIYTNDFSLTGNPTLPDQFYGYLEGNWKDGTPQTYGGTGYGGVSPCRYMFPNGPYDGGWNMDIAGYTGIDIRALSSCEPFSLDAGDTTCIDIALVTAFSFSDPPPGSYPDSCQAKDAVEVLKSRIPAVRDFYAGLPECLTAYQQNPDNNTAIASASNTTTVSLYPMPATGRVWLHVPASWQSSELHYRLMNVQGAVIMDGTLPASFTPSLDLQSIPNGYYTIEISGPDGERVVVKCVKE